MPEPSELFTNIFVKGYGAEVIFVPLYTATHRHAHNIHYLCCITMGSKQKLLSSLVTAS